MLILILQGTVQGYSKVTPPPRLFSKSFKEEHRFKMEYHIICFDLRFSLNHNNLINSASQRLKISMIALSSRRRCQEITLLVLFIFFFLFSCEGNEQEVNIRVTVKVMFVFARICPQIASYFNFVLD